MMGSALGWWLLCGALLFCVACNLPTTHALGCLDENGNDVDWWIIMKTPYMPGNANPNVASGFGYAYADANAQTLQLTAKRLDTNTNGALGSTLGQIYSASASDTAWFMYNDEPPKGTAGSDYGHTKGDLAFNKNGGFWLIHSVPRFPAEQSGSYSYPDNEKDYGQSFLCMSLDLETFNDVGYGVFLLNRPYIYSMNLPNALSILVQGFYEVVMKNWITKVPASNATTIQTSGGASFTVFAKNAKWNNNLYSELVAPSVGSSLLVETWMNGAISNKMPTFCAGSEYKYSTINVRQVSINSAVSWPETKDHSKWAITTGGSRKVYCIGDENRQYSQAKRGGGTACQSNGQIWASLNQWIATADKC
eukprot:TRINITY_DN1162_c0_g1_i1.p1 TRINITY_DN1162_c0_g1~~TRINITY_DN1162_c0_g1_i1.p1  ORF type:complete len:364 (+),score=50.09 TRINITY_DN1162_c0_g1_i1:16-1107(+)